MKKILSAGLALTLLLLCVVPAFAEDLNIKPNDSAEVEISTKGEIVYELSFPADIEIPWMTSSSVLGAVRAERMHIEYNKAVKVSVSSENDYNLVNENDSTRMIAYDLTGDDAIVFLPGDYGKGFVLNVDVTEAQWLQAAAGRHSDILTFTVEYTHAE